MKRGVPEETTFGQICRSGTLEEVNEAIARHGKHIVHVPDEQDGNYPLYDACCNRLHSVAIVNQLLLIGASSSFYTARRDFPLLKAVVKSNFELVELLLEKDVAMLNSCSEKGWSLLHYACYIIKEETAERDLKIADLLLKHGINMSIQSKSGALAIHTACEFGQPVFVQRLLEKMPTLLNAQTTTRHTPIMCALYNSRHGPEIISLLLPLGPDLTITCPRNGHVVTVYGLAYMIDKLDCLKLLPPYKDELIARSCVGANWGDPIASFNISRYYGHNAIYISQTLLKTEAYDYRHWWTTHRMCPELNMAYKPRNLLDWKWYCRENATRSNAFLLHKAAATNMETLQVVMQQLLNPFILNPQNKLPIDCAATSEIRQALLEYARWSPRIPQKTWWMGPFFQQRAFTLLLICRRQGVPKDVVHIIVEHVAANECKFIDK